MITQYTSPFIPSSVVDGHFPQADEGGLSALGAAWDRATQVVDGENERLSSLMRSLASNWSGTGADTAQHQLQTVSDFATSVASATTVVGTRCATAASYVTNTKTGINVVLAALDTQTKRLLLAGMADPLAIPAVLLRIQYLRSTAHTLILAYYKALATALSSLDFAVQISPQPAAPGAPTTTTASYTTPGSTSAPAGAPASGTSATGSPGLDGSLPDVVPTAAPATTDAGWTGGLASLVVPGDTAAFVRPAKTDTQPGTTPTDQQGAAGQTSASTPGTSQSSTPDLMSDTNKLTDAMTSPHAGQQDPSSAFTDSGSQNSDSGVPSSGQGADATTAGISPSGQHDATAALTGPPGLSDRTQQAITDAVTGTGSVDDVARALGGHSGHSHAGVEASPSVGTPVAPPAAAQAAPAPPPAGSGGGAAGGGSGSGATWSGGTNPVAAPAASVAQPAPAPAVDVPQGTGAAAAGTDAAPANAAPAPPVVPMANTNAFLGSTPTGVSGPSIQIAPGQLSAPVSGGGLPGLAGSPGGALPGTTTPLGGTLPGPAAPSAGAQPGPLAPVPASQAGPGSQTGPTLSQTQPLRVDATRPAPVPPGPETGVDPGVVTIASAIAALGLAGAAAQHFTALWQDLGTTSVLRPAGAVLPTQFGRDDALLAALPLGMGTVYQKVLLPGEADQLLAGQIETVRGLVHPYPAVRQLRTPQELYDALGLGFAVAGGAGSDTLAFARGAASYEVLRFAGVRLDDLVTPVAEDVQLPAGTIPAPLVRHHARPWTGTGEAPGSTSSDIIEEHEILSYASVAIPHLAEIWRLHADGREEYVSTYSQRTAQWLGTSTTTEQPPGRRIDNGAYATLADGTVHRAVVLTEDRSVLVAYGVSAPEHFEQAHDGSYRLVVDNSQIVSLAGVTTIGSWRGLPVQLLHRQGTMLLVDYAGDDRAAAAAAGFLQVNQGQWTPRWVEHAEVTGVRELERPYAVPRSPLATPAPANA